MIWKIYLMVFTQQIVQNRWVYAQYRKVLTIQKERLSHTHQLQLRLVMMIVLYLLLMPSLQLKQMSSSPAKQVQQMEHKISATNRAVQQFYRQFMSIFRLNTSATTTIESIRLPIRNRAYTQPLLNTIIATRVQALNKIRSKLTNLWGRILLSFTHTIHPIFNYLLTQHLYFTMSQQIIPEETAKEITKRDSFESAQMGSQQPTLNKQKNEEQADEGLVVAARTIQRVHSDRLERTWDEMYRKQHVALPKMQKREPMQKQVSEIERKKPQFSNVSDMAANLIGELMQKYKFSNSNRFMIDSTQKVRSQFKERVVSYLLYAIQELRQFHKDLSPKQLEIVSLNHNQQLQLSRRIAIEIELGLIKYHNKDLRGKIQRNYRDRANTILVNVRDQNNLQLRRKLINGSMDGSRVAVVDQVQLFTQARRQEIFAKARQQIAQMTMPSMEQQTVVTDQIIYNDIKEPQAKIQKPLQQKHKNPNQNKLAEQLKNLIQLQINGFKQKILNDLPQTEASLIIKQLRQIFPHNPQIIQDK